MNDLDLASCASASTIVNEQKIEVHQVTMSQINQFAVFAHIIKEQLNTKKIDADVAESIFTSCSMPILMMLSITTKLEVMQLADLAKQDQDGFIELIIKAIKQNIAYFDQKEEKPKTKPKNKKSESIFETFQFLISMGHQHSEIMNMSYGAFVKYAEAASKRYKVNLFTHAAPHLDKKAQDEYRKDLAID